jgi:hypothetical protein
MTAYMITLFFIFMYTHTPRHTANSKNVVNKHTREAAALIYDVIYEKWI